MKKLIVSAVDAKDGKRHFITTDVSDFADRYDIGFVQDRVGQVTLAVQRYHPGTPHMTADLILHTRRGRFIGPDEPVRVANGAQKDETVWLPGQAVKGYFAYPSPDLRYLALERDLFHGFSTMQLYRVEAASAHQKAGRLTPVHRNGLRFDEFLLRRLLQLRREVAILPHLTWRSTNFEWWKRGNQGYSRLRVNFGGATDEQHRGLGGPAGVAEVDVAEGHVLLLTDETGKKYNSFSNQPS